MFSLRAYCLKTKKKEEKKKRERQRDRYGIEQKESFRSIVANHPRFPTTVVCWRSFATHRPHLSPLAIALCSFRASNQRLMTPGVFPRLLKKKTRKKKNVLCITERFSLDIFSHVEIHVFRGKKNRHRETRDRIYNPRTRIIFPPIRLARCNAKNVYKIDLMSLLTFIKANCRN